MSHKHLFLRKEKGLKQCSCGLWQGDIWLGRERKRPTDTNKKQLQTILAKLRDDYRLGKHGLSKSKSLTFGQACDAYLSQYAIPNGQKMDQYYLPFFRAFLGETTPLSSITEQTLRSLMAAMLEKWEPSTAKRRWTLLASIFRENGYRHNNPCRVVKKPRGADTARLRYLTTTEVGALLGNSEGEERLFYQVALHTGFRLGNLVRLEWAHIDWNRNILHAYRTKSDRSYVVPMNAELRTLLAEQHKTQQSQFVFSRRNWGRVMLKRVRGLGWQDVSIHTLRHTFASHLVMKGVDLLTVSRLLGHSSIKVTERYAHLAPDYMLSAVNQLSFRCGERLLEEARNVG